MMFILAIIFMGDFLQMATVSGLEVYKDNGPKWELAYRIWKSLNPVVILTEQMRQSEDPEFSTSTGAFW